jgi:hypothetical protein
LAIVRGSLHRGFDWIGIHPLIFKGLRFLRTPIIMESDAILWGDMTVRLTMPDSRA